MARIVYSILLETEHPPDGQYVAFIAPLDSKGRSPHIRPLGKPSVVDLRPGDWFTHRPTRKRYTLAGITAYRQHQLSDEQAAARTSSLDGYLVPR